MAPSIIEFVCRFGTDKTFTDNGSYFFWDWFCKDSSLPARARKLAKYLKDIAYSPKINPSTMCVCFKNTCPLNGELFDEIQIADIQTDKLLFNIAPHYGHHSTMFGLTVVDSFTRGEQTRAFYTWEDAVVWFHKKD